MAEFYGTDVIVDSVFRGASVGERLVLADNMGQVKSWTREKFAALVDEALRENRERRELSRRSIDD